MLILFVIFILIILNGYFSAAEIALVSVKKYKVHNEAARGNKKAAQLEEYLKKPSEYLSTIQVGLTLIGLFEGLYGGEVFQKILEPKLVALGLSANIAHLLSTVIGIGLITYVTIIVGELLPKSLALKEPQTVAMKILPTFKIFSFLALPFVKILTASTRLIVRLFHIGNTENQNLTDEDLKSLLGIAYQQGTLEKEELTLHQNIFSFYEQSVEVIMTPQKEVISIRIDQDPVETDTMLRNSHHNYFPVIGAKKEVLGLLCARDYFRENDKAVPKQVKPACTIHRKQKASQLLQKFKEHNQNVGIVVNEEGQLLGIVTMHDIGESLIGQIP